MKYLLLICISLFSFNMLIAQNTNWTGTDGNWDNAANWDNGVPDATKRAFVNGAGKNITLPAGLDAVANSIILNNGSTLTIEDGASLQITNSPSYGVDVRGGGSTLRNHGILNINDNIGYWGFNNIFQGKLINEATGIVNIDNTGTLNSTFGYGIYAQDGIQNYGILNIGLNTTQSPILIENANFTNRTTGQIFIAGAPGSEDGIKAGGSVHNLTNEAGGIICIEDALVDGELIGSSINFTNNGTLNTFGCSAAAIPTMGEWSLIILALIILSLSVIYLMRWNKTLAIH